MRGAPWATTTIQISVNSMTFAAINDIADRPGRQSEEHRWATCSSVRRSTFRRAAAHGLRRDDIASGAGVGGNYDKRRGHGSRYRDIRHIA
jgi:hypothetical protein